METNGVVASRTPPLICVARPPCPFVPGDTESAAYGDLRPTVMAAASDCQHLVGRRLKRPQQAGKRSRLVQHRDHDCDTA
jgi:hypothetical protein